MHARTCLVALVAAFASLGVGCKQRAGEVCEQASDCAAGLVCCETSLATGRRGICTAEGMCRERPTADAGPRPDAAGTDAGLEDASVAEDAATDTDAGRVDAGRVDAGRMDAGRDAGARDAGRDAGPRDGGLRIDTGVVLPLLDAG